MSGAPPSPKSRLPAVHRVPDRDAARGERVLYQLEDTGHPLLRLRTTLRVREEDGLSTYHYRVDAFSRITGGHLGEAAMDASPGSRPEFAARSRQFQSRDFREVVDRLRDEVSTRYRDAVPELPVQR